jgi:hypothetical protein
MTGVADDSITQDAKNKKKHTKIPVVSIYVDHIKPSNIQKKKITRQSG